MNQVLVKNIDIDIYQNKYNCYILAGNESFFIKRTVIKLRNNTKVLGFVEYSSIVIDNHTEWNNIFHKFLERNIFYKKEIINLIFLDKKIFINCKKKIINLFKIINIDIILILEIHTDIAISSNFIFKIINNHFFLLRICNKLNNIQLINWVFIKIKKLNLLLNSSCCKLLCYLYEDNLTFLYQTLKDISLLYPKKSNINLKFLSKITNNFLFIKSHDLIFSKKIQHSINILNKLKHEQISPYLILSKIEKNIFLLLILKRNMNKDNFYYLLKKSLIPIDKYSIIKKILKKITHDQLYLSIKLLLEIEINIKTFIINDYIKKYFWIDLEQLILLIL
ncbi:DNA polymerase III subunit delta [Enterobacteriaceae endosymbiont of Plateumaris consimilis]|uniref:DNA polymerase III subunit delta n=1 Tax=Enterobacteriaceae endosymbiont of Plateumaris consimilis TaxID=2675794 RepID=UPI00144A1F5D|nr:DNA polymerase III subunit delta [Enterobacteriaceae endosymbiont of Plateumaris consimilis]QJC28703.1 DNA polymerase III subunit delta [Enterobacteriaceae endosymbiont of Plateumaris consimilis]